MRTALTTLLVFVPGGLFADAPQAPPWLPHYDVAVNLDVAAHQVHTTEHITWVNRHNRPATELVLNVHSAFKPPDSTYDRLFQAKMLEIMRVPFREGMYREQACRIKQVSLLQWAGTAVQRTPLPFHFLDDPAVALQVDLPQALPSGAAVSIAIDFDFELPQKQGRWGQWKGVTFLSNWLPVLAYYDEAGWHPTPYIAWHQSWFNEAGVYTAHVHLPADQVLACTGSISRSEVNGPARDVWIGPVVSRDFALLASNRFEEHVAWAGKVKVKCIAFPEHAYYGEKIASMTASAVVQFSLWFGPLPYTELTVVESYFGWNGNQCGDLIMIDERVFNMPRLSEGAVEYLVTHETCHQWWYNIIGNDGYRETFLDEAFATYFAHRMLNGLRGKNNAMLHYPEGLEWLPNIHREDFKYSQFYSALGRDEIDQAVQPLDKYAHLGILYSSIYDRGQKIVGMIEENFDNPAAFIDFLHGIYNKYYFRVLQVEDLKRELKEYTGGRVDWDGFFGRWLFDKGMTDWAVERVNIEREQPIAGPMIKVGGATRAMRNPGYRVEVRLRQKAEYDEPTVLGFSFQEDGPYTLRVRIDPRLGVQICDDPPARIVPREEGRVDVEIILSEKPVQIAVDPDQVLPDRDPANNYWKAPWHLRVTPVYTFLDETSLTAAYDRWNLIIGPWLYGPSFSDAWFTRSDVVGLRAGVYRTEQFNAGAYIGWRPDFRDIAAGFDATISNPLFPKTEFGLHGEQNLALLNDTGSSLDRFSMYARYIIQESPSLYAAPAHDVELFAAWQENFLPYPRNYVPDAIHVNELTQTGIHYHFDMLTPYWDPDVGAKIDATYAAGLKILGCDYWTNTTTGQISWMLPVPEGLGYWSDTHIACRAFGAIATPTNLQLLSLGGSQLFRGFDMRERQGNASWIGSAEWRLPIIRDAQYDALDNVVGVRNVYLAPFYDAGDIYLAGKPQGPIAHAVGIGTRLDVEWFGMIERTTLRMDVAKTVNENSAVQFWFGIMHPF